MKLVLLVGPPGSGKSTKALQYPEYAYVNQDLHGKTGHMEIFESALSSDIPILVDRMNFSREQRNRYLEPAKAQGYETEIVVLHESRETCLQRCRDRKNHSTIQDDKAAHSALNTFFKLYETVLDCEADSVVRLYSQGRRSNAVVFDLDGTMCNVDHRLHYVRSESRKDWKSFFRELSDDKPNEWCKTLYFGLSGRITTVFCSGRPDSYRKETQEWLDKEGLGCSSLYMRPRNDMRRDDIVKEIILDFEILTRYNPIMFIDDRQQVVDMYRRRGFICLQVAPGDF